ncbi:MAG TPA: hypothetical protein VK859_17450, partial [bacterium]|nr:hypothetical protein [bacterium]
IFLPYGELHWVEMEINKLGQQPPTEEIRNRMKHLEERADRVRVSANYIPMLYSLKENIAYVRGRLGPPKKV